MRKYIYCDLMSFYTYTETDMFIDNEFSDLRIIELQHMGINASRHGFENENVRKFIYRQDLQFDLIFIELFFSESWLMFAHKFNAPIVGISKFHYVYNYN